MADSYPCIVYYNYTIHIHTYTYIYIYIYIYIYNIDREPSAMYILRHSIT